MVPMLCTSSFPLCQWALPLGTEHGDRNTECDYSSAYVSIYTDNDLVGHGVRPFCFSNALYAQITNNQMTFTIGRGNDIVRPISPAHVTNTDAGNIGLHGNPTSRGPACRKENRRLVCEYGKDLGLSRL